MVKKYLKIELYNTDSGFNHYGISHLNIEGKLSVTEGYFPDNDTDTTFDNPKTEYNLTVGDKFYFLPGVSVPRIKLKDLASSHKIKTVKDINDATVIFTGRKTMHSVTDYVWHHAVPKEGLLSFLASAKENGNISDYEYEKLVPVISASIEDMLCTDYQTRRLLEDVCIPYYMNNIIVGSNKFVTINPDYSDLYHALQTKELYTEDALYPHLNGPDATIIDEGMYESISEMFKSSDNDNCTLAMEIMANCDYNESIAYLGLLFNSYGVKIYAMKSKNHVNFKSLMNYMGNSPSSPSMSKDDIVKSILDKGLLKAANAKILMDAFSHELGYGGNSRYFRIKSVCFSTDVDKALEAELTLQVKKDYVPETPQEQEEVIVEEPIEENEPTNTEFDPFEF